MSSSKCTAGAAEEDKQRLAVTLLSSRQLRAAEVPAKIWRRWRPCTPANGREPGDVRPFVLTIRMGDGKTEQIEAMPMNAPAAPEQRGRCSTSSPRLLVH